MNSRGNAVIVRPVRVVGWKPFLGQSPWVEVKPEFKIEKPSITTPINIELGSLPVSIGLFAGSGLVFLLRTALPDGWPKTASLVAGGGLAAAGIVNLILPKAKAETAKPAAPASPAAPPSGAVAPEGKPSGFVPPSIPAFNQIQMEIVTPLPDQEVEHLGWFFTTPKIPVTLRLYNPTKESVTFNLDFEWDEYPSVMGYNREPVHGFEPFQVTLAPGEERNQLFELPMVANLATSTAVGLAVFRKRTPEENRFLVSSRTFTIV